MNKAIATLALLTVMLMPSPAFAWWGWLDRLSGAGDFWGLLFNVRAVCFGEKYRGPTLSEVLEAIALAERLEQQAAREQQAADGAYNRAGTTKNWDEALKMYEIAAASSSASAEAWEAARRKWLASASAWARILGEQPPNTLGPGPGGRGSEVKPPEPSGTAGAAAVSSAQQELQQRIDLVLKPRITTSNEVVAQAKAELKKTPEEFRQVFEERQQRNAFALSLGVIFSACPDDRGRRSSIDVETGFWQVLDDESPYADDRLSTAKVAYTLRLFDVLDYSVAAGVFWITSRRYDAVRGVYFEPGRLYVHAPASWSTLSFKTNLLKRILAVPVFSAGTLLFPNGFRENAFGDNERIRGELVPSFAVFANVRPAKRRPKVNP